MCLCITLTRLYWNTIREPETRKKSRFEAVVAKLLWLSNTCWNDGKTCRLCAVQSVHGPIANSVRHSLYSQLPPLCLTCKKPETRNKMLFDTRLRRGCFGCRMHAKPMGFSRSRLHEFSYLWDAHAAQMLHWSFCCLLTTVHASGIEVAFKMPFINN